MLFPFGQETGRDEEKQQQQQQQQQQQLLILAYTSQLIMLKVTTKSA